MTAQKRETGKNYIGLLHEETEEQRLADLSPAAKHRIMDHIVDLMAAMLRRRGQAGVVTSEVVTSEVTTPALPRR